MSTFNYTNTCAFCGKESRLEIDKDSYDKYVSGLSAQKAFPKMNSFEREVMISGTCFDCQSKLFNQPKPGEYWGEIVTTCDTCGANIYAKDLLDGMYAYECPCCGCEDSEV